MYFVDLVADWLITNKAMSASVSRECHYSLGNPLRTKRKKCVLMNVMSCEFSAFYNKTLVLFESPLEVVGVWRILFFITTLSGW